MKFKITPDFWFGHALRYRLWVHKEDELTGFPWRCNGSYATKEEARVAAFAYKQTMELNPDEVFEI